MYRSRQINGKPHFYYGKAKRSGVNTNSEMIKFMIQTIGNVNNARNDEVSKYKKELIDRNKKNNDFQAMLKEKFEEFKKSYKDVQNENNNKNNEIKRLTDNLNRINKKLENYDAISEEKEMLKEKMKEYELRKKQERLDYKVQDTKNKQKRSSLISYKKRKYNEDLDDDKDSDYESNLRSSNNINNNNNNNNNNHFEDNQPYL